MLRWRLPLGVLIVAILVGLAWLDHLAEVRLSAALAGICLLPVALVFAVAASREILQLAAGGGMRPVPWAVYGGNVLLVVSGWLPQLYTVWRGHIGGAEAVSPAARAAWPLAALAVGVMLVFAGEMRRYRNPGGVTVNLAAAVFALVYVGVMLGFVIQLRMAWGVGALASLVIVVKLGDTGAYTAGRLIGRHRMAPVLSPGKTVEGAIGGLAFACLGSWATFRLLLPRLMEEGAGPGAWWHWLLFSLLAGTAGMLGDLAESLLKRDAGRKDSSDWLPGFGGVLDLLDSILLAAPVAWFCWLFLAGAPVGG